MKQNEIEQLEIKLLLEAVFHRYGFDFRGYAMASIRRRIIHFMRLTGCPSIADLIPKVIHQESFFEKLVREFSITVTEMFRDPTFYISLRQNVIPLLKSYPSVRVWLAGCATGEEAYSLAILMDEEEVAERVTFFATDYNEVALGEAREGIYDLRKAQKYTSNYQDAGGRYSFSDYYHAKYDAIVINSSLKKNITFANHNLVTDHIFSETHLILCRNVLIYFNKQLQERVIQLFYESLVHGGYLCLGMKEGLMCSGLQEKFEVVDRKNRIFRKNG